MFKSTKTYGHNIGLSCCFRQWRSTHSHCQYLHGYAIQVRLVFTATELDERNWVFDFGGLKPVKKWLEDIFDHKTLVASDDPMLDDFLRLESKGGIDLVVVTNTGCEAFSKMIFNHVDGWLKKEGYHPRVALSEVEVAEHGANSAIYKPGELNN